MTTNQKPTVFTRAKASKKLAVLMAGALLGATALTVVSNLSPSQPARAESVLNKAPKQGFADLVEKVMPTVVSVEVRYAPVVNRRERDSFSGSDHSERFSPNHGQI